MFQLLMVFQNLGSGPLNWSGLNPTHKEQHNVLLTDGQSVKAHQRFKVTLMHNDRLFPHFIFLNYSLISNQPANNVLHQSNWPELHTTPSRLTVKMACEAEWLGTTTSSHNWKLLSSKK